MYTTHYTTYRAEDPCDNPETQAVFIKNREINPDFAFTRKQLYKYTNWNKTLMEKYLGQADATIPNIENPLSEYPLKLYLSTRIKRAERYASFQAKLPTHLRIEEPLVIYDAIDPTIDKEQLIREIETAIIDPEATNLSTKELYKRACKVANEQYELRTKLKGNQTPQTYSETLLNSKSINYLRHHATNYNTLINQIDDAGLSLPYADKLRIRIAQITAEAYPFLEEECENQLSRRGLSLH